MKKIYVMLLILLGFSFLTSCQLDKDILLGNKEPHEHVLVPEWTQNDKYHWHACSGCDKIVEKEAHDFGSWVEVKEATEYEAGEEKRECICGLTETRVIERLDHTHKPTGEYGHNDKYHWETCSECDAQLNKKSHTGGVATCQEKATCSICNVQYGSLSNKHVYGEYVVISEATCKERAIEEARCTVDGCQAKDTRYVPGSTIASHKWGEWTYIEGSATCLKDGIEERGCLTCSSKETRNAEGTKLDHHASSEVLFDGNSHWNSCDVTKGCTEKLNVVAHSYDNDCDEVCNGCAHERQGHHTFDNACDKVCNICEAERYTPDHTGGTATCLLPAICTECGTPYGLPLEHTYHNECDATCNMCGLVTRVPKPHRGGTATCEEKAICEECGLPYGNLLSHRFGTWVSEVPATCEEDGVKAHKYCSLCEKNYDEHGNVIVSLVISAKGHKLGDLVTKVEPTCVDGGMKAHYQCLTCSEYFDANKVKVDELELVIPANGHNLTFNALVPATCENVGKLAHYHCSSCGKDYEDNEATTELTNLVIEALGHSYGEWVPAKAATCEDAGNVGYFQCSECDKYFDINRNELTSVVIDALGHSYGTTLVGKDKIHHGYKCSTCGEFKDLENHTPGAEATENTDQVCTVCNYILAPATNHVNHVADQSAWITNSTHHWHKCVGCDIVVESSKAEHDYTNTCDTTCNTCGYIREITHDYEAVITNPTCEESGYTTYTCEVCGDVKVDNYINALGHVVVIDKAKAATCEDTGLSEGSHCDRCNSVLVAQIVVDALGHDEVTHTAKAATCTEIGWDAYVTCSRCEYTTYNEIPALNHDLVSHEAKAATCEDIGCDAYVTCSRCEYTTYQEIAKLGHEVVVDDAVLPSCEESGKTAGSHCSRCNTVYVAQEEIAALGHDWKDATCTAPKTCNTCGDTEGEKLEHIFENEKEDGPRYWNECDCGQKDIVYMHVYFKPNSNWKDANAWFAAYCFGNGDKWYELKDNNSDGLYETVVDSTTYDSIIFVRMNPAKETLDWSSKWDQTANLELQTDNKTIFTVKEGDWNNATGQWTEYSEENYVNIYFANTKEWTTVYAYAWGGSVNNAGWAGVPMTLVEKDVFGVDIYLISLNKNFVNIIFNDTSKQTIDLTVPTNGDCLFTITGESGGKYTGSWGCYHQCSEIEYNETHHYYTCTICGDEIKTEEHTNNATCDESYKCLCGKEFLAKGHTMTVIPGVDATCTVEGSTAGVKCGVCQEILVPTTVIPALGHDEVTHIAKAATCTEIGWDAYVTCNRCEHTTYNEIPALDHAYEYKYYNKAGDEITSGSEVSCAQDLVYRGTCSNDINHVTEVFVKGKDLIDNDLNIIVKHDNVSPVTCVSDSVCTDCGFVMQEKTPSNHAYGAWIITQEPTASSIGVAEKDCQYCDAKEVFVVPALTKANYYDENSTLPYEYHAPTCSEKGVEIFRVIIGGQVIGEFTNELDELDHSPEEDDNDCETPTLCEHCGEKLVDGKAHTYVDSVCSVCGKFEEIGHILVKTDAKASTCEEQGNNAYWTCEVCEQVFADEEGTQKTTVEAQKLPLDSHDLVKTDAKASTCKEQGNNAYWTCEVCEKVFADEAGTQVTTVEAQKLPLAGHTPAADDGDCTTAINCSVCGTVTTAAKANHDFEEAYEVIVGITVYEKHQCGVCSKEETISQFERATVYYYNSENWTEVAAYAWDSVETRVLGDWPGSLMTAEADGWYTITISATSLDDLKIIFNSHQAENASQTPDIELDSDYVYFYGKNNVGYATATEALEAYHASLVAPKEYLYLKPNSNWTQANARFAAYFFGNGDTWVSMTDSNSDGIYEVEVPDGGYTKVIFVRMNPSTSVNNWDNKWNQTGDLTIPTDGKNLFTVPSGAWDGSTSKWSTYTPSA